ncbi:hypothetical protein [Flavobacterium geliluteum]|uniref:DUF600 domain-containing protein n=1 Tax=Flavobacterium geliluteum TaxID=2816120 RepID=A0A940XD47_9FLAO|nr:hypothetical protein [Flavobacterium geliluteum]MBP4137585.1 hypothetical protein [Flavobacterium geliluteum]
MDYNEFDTLLQNHIKNLLEISLDYTYNSKNIDNIFIYCLIGQNKYFDIIYQNNDKYFERHKIYLINSNFLVTDDRQDWLIQKIVNERNSIESLFKKFEREVPFELKIIYSPKSGKLDVKFNYDDPLKNEDSAIGDGFRSWIKSLGIEF